MALTNTPEANVFSDQSGVFAHMLGQRWIDVKVLHRSCIYSQRMRILIVGGGLGGMMLAASLEQRGLHYDLIEQSPEKHDQGYSLGVWCNSQNLFQSLGLQGPFDKLGTKIHIYDICDSSGRQLRAFRFDPFYSRYGMAYTQVNRRQLRDLLSSKTDPTRISFNTKLVAMNQSPAHVEVTLSDGPVKRYDLVIGADGVHSLVRDLAFGKSLQTFTGWRGWYVWIDKRFGKRAGMTEFLGPGRCLGIFDDGDRALAIFFATCVPAAPDDPADRVALLKELFKSELAHLPGALDTIRGDEVMSTDLASVRMKRWIHNRAILLGDAAHAFEPHTGLGASMAMEDAYVLANEIALVSSGYPIAEALNNYQRMRQQRVAIAQRLNWKIRTFAFIRTGMMRSIANLLIPHMPENLFTRSYFKLFDQTELTCGKAGTQRVSDSQFVAKQI
jgi:2-polyprenyl-6-methoxyphenol hydroxylase-like FAD-dependent oxidoreductase